MGLKRVMKRVGGEEGSFPPRMPVRPRASMRFRKGRGIRVPDPLRKVLRSILQALLIAVCCECSLSNRQGICNLYEQVLPAPVLPDNPF